MLQTQHLTFADVNFFGWLIGSILFGFGVCFLAKSKIKLEK